MYLCTARRDMPLSLRSRRRGYATCHRMHAQRSSTCHPWSAASSILLQTSGRVRRGISSLRVERARHVRWSGACGLSTTILGDCEPCTNGKSTAAWISTCSSAFARVSSHRALDHCRRAWPVSCCRADSMATQGSIRVLLQTTVLLFLSTMFTLAAHLLQHSGGVSRERPHSFNTPRRSSPLLYPMTRSA